MGNMGSPTMGMANNSTGSLTPPPLGLFGVTNRLAAAGGPADRAFALGGGIFPPRTPTLGMSSLFFAKYILSFIISVADPDP